MEFIQKNLLYRVLIFLLFLLNQCSDPSDSSDLVFITNTGSQYHTENCSYLGKSKIPVHLREAWEKGYNPCHRCYPDISSPAAAAGKSTQNEDRPEPENDTVEEKKARQSKRSVEKENLQSSRRCTGITLKGRQCKRMTKNPNGRCYQHQAD